MAKITAATNEKVIQLKSFLGLNENPDGDTKLKMGEAAELRNWAVTRDLNLKRRPGSLTIAKLGAEAVKGMWYGNIRGSEYFLAASGGKLYVIWNEASGDQLLNKEVGTLDTSGSVSFLGYGREVYILNGKEYYQFDGELLKPVEGYVPLVNIAVPPVDTEGVRSTLEKVNRLTGKRRMWISPDAKGTVFAIPEKPILSVDAVIDLKTGQPMDASKYSVNLEEGKVTFTEVLPKAVNSYEIQWTVENPLRQQILNMRYAEIFGGSKDSRVFIYGDGTNKCYYSGIDYDGNGRADYFPDLNDIAVGSENEKITALIRHYGTLMCYKENSAWCINQSFTTLEDGTVIPAFYLSSTNKTIGNAPMGQVQLVLNSPVTLHGSDLYEWHNTSSYASNLSKDERQAKRISDRIFKTLGEFKLEDCICYDDNYNQEYYICYGGRALVHNYAADVWYLYTNLDIAAMVSVRNELFFGTNTGEIKHLSYDHLSDDGEDIDAYWESGSQAFGVDYMRKYSAQLWVGLKPDSNGEVWVTVQTDRKSNYIEKMIASSLATFSKANFRRWSFATNRKPQVYKLKIKAKKFVYYKLVFKSKSHDTTATILAADIRVRTTGYAK